MAKTRRDKFSGAAGNVHVAILARRIHRLVCLVNDVVIDVDGHAILVLGDERFLQRDLDVAVMRWFSLFPTER